MVAAGLGSEAAPRPQAAEDNPMGQRRPAARRANDAMEAARRLAEPWERGRWCPLERLVFPPSLASSQLGPSEARGWLDLGASLRAGDALPPQETAAVAEMTPCAEAVPCTRYFSYEVVVREV